MDLLYGLNYPAEYRLELLQTLSHYEQALDALLELAAPYARQLEAQLEGRAGSWRAQPTTGRRSLQGLRPPSWCS